MQNFVYINFLMFIYYYIIDYIATKLNFISGDIFADLNFVIVASIVSYILALITLNKYNDYLG